MSGRLVVVSNRVAPVRADRAGNQGGLAVAVHAALRERGGLWFGWSGQIVEAESTQPELFSVGRLACATVDLTQRNYDEYYAGYANRILWPLFHYRLDLTDFSRRDMAGYARVNALFAGRLVPLLEPDDQIWVHDYHLIPFAECLRHAGCQHRIGFFLHIPWPALDVLLALPNHRTLVRALSAYDLVGFQTDNDLRAFHEYIEREAEGRLLADGWIEAFGRRFRAGAFPIGIDTENVVGLARRGEGAVQSRRLIQSLNGRQLVIGVDRLDYTKGIPNRVEAFEYLLRNYPEQRNRVVLLQIAPPSRSDVPEYREIRQEVEAAAGGVNAAYAEFDWAPVRYLNKGFNRATLTGFFRHARVGLVTPLRDGMNLVAKEYVASQSEEDPGVLVLSRFAGAARELEGALIVNPFNIEGVGDSLQVALSMSLEERRERWQALFRQVSENDVHAWHKHFLDTLAQTDEMASA